MKFEDIKEQLRLCVTTLEEKPMKKNPDYMDVKAAVHEYFDENFSEEVPKQVSKVLCELLIDAHFEHENIHLYYRDHFITRVIQKLTNKTIKIVN